MIWVILFILINFALYLQWRLRTGPHFVIGSADEPYLERWHLIPRNRFVNVYLHHFVRGDDDRELHDHPWSSLSICLKGEYGELLETGFEHRRFLSVVYRPATAKHRIVLPAGCTAWTLFITGPKVRDWGFWCGERFVPWREFVSRSNKGEIGKGCD